MALADRIREANRLDPEGLVPFIVADAEVGLADAAFADRLAGFPDVFALDGGNLRLADTLATPEARSAAVAAILGELRTEGLVPGWRDELYPVFTEPDAAPLLLVERASATLFGIATVAVNLNGYVVGEDGDISIWLQRRSLTKPINPGRLDVLVSGGQPAGADPFENLVKECAEEASIPARIARRAAFAGTVGFRARRDDGVHHGHYLNYDLALPSGFRPDNRDGEVESFHLWTADKVIDVMSSSEDMAFDSALVVIDFLIRHGVIGEDHPEHAALVQGLGTWT
ncbi:MAG: DUF4743 domain-containing protein [Rhodospirillales bacterium]